jgi:hypothetical protein
MKKTYVAPDLVVNGSALAETRGVGIQTADSPGGLSGAPGSVGFNL